MSKSQKLLYWTFALSALIVSITYGVNSYRSARVEEARYSYYENKLEECRNVVNKKYWPEYVNDAHIFDYILNGDEPIVNKEEIHVFTDNILRMVEAQNENPEWVSELDRCDTEWLMNK